MEICKTITKKAREEIRKHNLDETRSTIEKGQKNTQPRETPDDNSRLRQPIDLELHRPVPNKAIGAAAFGFAGPDGWNKLPERLRKSASLNIFKRDLKTHLFNNTF